MSKKVALALGGSALGDDLTGRMKAVKITSQTIVDLTARGHEVIIIRGNGPQVDMISQTFEAVAKTEAHSPILLISVCAALSQGHISYDLQNVLGEELFSRGISKPAATLVAQIKVDANNPAFLNPTKPIGLFFTEQKAKQLTKQDHTLKEGAGRGHRRVVASPKSADIIEEETVRAPVDAGQMVITVGGDSIPVVREGNHLRDASTVIDRDWASARLTEMIDADMLIILTVVEKMAINFGKENEQWLDHLSLSDTERFIEEGHFAKGSILPKVETTTSFARSHAGREALITTSSKAKEGIESRAGAVICR